MFVQVIITVSFVLYPTTNFIKCFHDKTSLSNSHRTKKNDPSLVNSQYIEKESVYFTP